jgi:predicted molibdopterin-dependent oxidoreductase YjgC
MDRIRLNIDGRKITTRRGNTILAAAREGGIHIPALCHHERLLPIGSCRLCVVEVEGYRNPMTACTTPALEGIVVNTRSEKLFRMRREFLKFILVSHPLDCLQCDKGGECRLQDLVYEHGIEKAEYEAFREDRKEAYATPLIRYWELRCVLCGRCTRACREVSGRAAIDIVGKGFDSRIAATDPGDCISCGECLSLCPVGALTETLSPVKSRVWQSKRIDTTCPHCGFGCLLTLDICEGGSISKVVPSTNEPPNHLSLCARGRFGYDSMAPPSRLLSPEQMTPGGRRTLAWGEALETAAAHLRRLSAAGKGLGWIVSARVTNEELSLLSRIAGLFPGSQIASSAFYHTGKAVAAFREAEIGWDGSGYDRISGCDLILVAGADLLVNNHLLANRVRGTVLSAGAKIIVIDPLPASLVRIADAHLQVTPGQDAPLFNALSRRLIEEGRYDRKAEQRPGFFEFRSALLEDSAARTSAPGGVVAEALEKACRLIGEADRIAVLLGSGITQREESLAALLNFCLLKGLPGRGAILPTALQANAMGATTIHGATASPEELLLSPDLPGLWIYEEDPFQFLNGEMVKAALTRKEFVAVCDVLPTEAMDFAHLTIPSTTFAEKEGTALSGDGKPGKVRKIRNGPPGGAEFLRKLLGRLEEKSSLDPAGFRDNIHGNIPAEGDGRKNAPGSGSEGRFLVRQIRSAQAVSETIGKERPYQLILRDLFASHHLTHREIPERGAARVQKDALNLSPEDAAALRLNDGEELCMESASGRMVRPVTIRKGIKPGVLECVLFRERRDALSLSPGFSKTVAVSLRKAATRNGAQED